MVEVDEVCARNVNRIPKVTEGRHEETETKRPVVVEVIEIAIPRNVDRLYLLESGEASGRYWINRGMNTSSLYYAPDQPSPMRLLRMAIEQEAEFYTEPVNAATDRDEIEASIRSIWLPIFRSASNLRFALVAAMTIVEQDDAARICQNYLEVLEDMYAGA